MAVNSDVDPSGSKQNEPFQERKCEKFIILLLNINYHLK